MPSDTVEVRTNVKTYSCGKSYCDFYRTVDTSFEGSKLILSHPIYGVVTVEELARLDIQHHDCRAHAEAVRKVRALALVRKEASYSVA